MTYVNKIGQTIEPGDVVSHTTASQYATLSVGLVRDIVETESPYRTTPEVHVKVTWVNHTRGYGDREHVHFIRTQVGLHTVTKVDPVTLDPELVERLAQVRMEGSNG